MAELAVNEEKMIQVNRLGQRFARHIERAVRTCVKRPFYQCQAKAADFNTGNAAGMHAASGVEERRVPGAEHRAVRMSGN